MARLNYAAVLAGALVVIAAVEASDLIDWLTGRDRDAELRQYLAEHRTRTWTDGT